MRNVTLAGDTQTHKEMRLATGNILKKFQQRKFLTHIPRCPESPLYARYEKALPSLGDDSKILSHLVNSHTVHNSCLIQMSKYLLVQMTRKTTSTQDSSFTT